MLLGGLALAVALGPCRLIGSMALLPRRHLMWASAAMALFQWSFFGAVAKAGATTATLVSTAAAPLAAGAIAAARRRCWPRGGWWSALGVASSGVSLVTAHGPNSAAAGVALAVLGGFLYAIFTVETAYLESASAGIRNGGLVSMAAALLFSALALLPVAGAHLGALLSRRGVMLTAYLGLVTTAVAYTLYALGLRNVTPTRTLALQLLQPLAGAALDLLLFRGRPDRLAAIGMVFLAASAWLLIAGSSRPCHSGQGVRA